MKNRMEKKPYIEEISSHPGKLWFRAKRYGWGWYPSTWQGWAILVMYFFALINGLSWVKGHPISNHDVLFRILPSFYIMTVFLIIICYATGEKPAWHWGRARKESLDVLERNGAKTGEIATRAEVHDKGLWHRAAHVYVLNSKGEVLLQRRAAHNSFRPGRWYLSAGGHLRAGETSPEAAARELKEELGISIDLSELKLAGTAEKEHVLLYGTYLNNEFDDIYIVHKDIDKAKLKKHGEVADIEWIPVTTFKAAIDGKDPAFVSYEGLPVLFGYFENHAG